MKSWVLRTFGLLFFLFLTTKASGQSVGIQKAEMEIQVQNRTLMERFEPELVNTPQERIQKKKDRIAAIERTKSVIDTLDISNRKRRKLLKDLKHNPFSTRLSKVFAENKYEEGME